MTDLSASGPPHPLDPILEARSVTIVGASRDPRKRGHQAVRALLDSGYQGEILPVNPRGEELLGLTVFPSIDALEMVPDLAYVATPRETVGGIVEACGQKGIRGAVVPAVGFRESDAEGAALEQALLDVAARTGIRVVGPNTSGILNTAIGLNLVGSVTAPPGRLALLTQSGNVALEIMRAMRHRSQGLSIYVGVGNASDIALHEYLGFLEQHPGTAAILVYAESFKDGRQFLQVASRVAAHKPIVLLKGGRSDRGSAAARSHTGAIAGSHEVLSALLEQSGVVEVGRTDELLAVGEVLAGQPRLPRGTGAVVLADGGGHATLAVDILSELGVELATLSSPVQDRLRTLLGPAAAVENPVDLAGAADRDPRTFVRALEMIVADPAAGGVLLTGLFGGYAIRFSVDLARVESQAARELAALMSETGKPLVVHSLYASEESEPLRRLSEAGVPVLGSLEMACRCVLAAYRCGLPAPDRPAISPPPRRPPGEPSPPIAIALAEGRSQLSEPEARQLAERNGVPLVPARLCRSADEVVAAMRELAAPVAIKLVSSTIAHRSEAGGVALDVANGAQGAAAFEQLARSGASYARAHGLEPDFRGVIVTPMLPQPIAELIVGAKQDPQFGPLLAVGPGGVNVELLSGAAVRALPITRSEANEMLDQLGVAPLLGGYRGNPPVDRESLITAILAVAECLLAHPELSVIEVNPLFAYEDRAVSVDVAGYLSKIYDGRG